MGQRKIGGQTLCRFSFSIWKIAAPGGTEGTKVLIDRSDNNFMAAGGGKEVKLRIGITQRAARSAGAFPKQAKRDFGLARSEITLEAALRKDKNAPDSSHSHVFFFW